MTHSTVTVNIADAEVVKQSLEQANEAIEVLKKQLGDREDALAKEWKTVTRLAQHNEALRALVLDMEGWILGVAPHSYLEGSKAQSIRERVKILTGLPKEDEDE